MGPMAVRRCLRPHIPRRSSYPPGVKESVKDHVRLVKIYPPVGRGGRRAGWALYPGGMRAPVGILLPFRANLVIPEGLRSRAWKGLTGAGVVSICVRAGSATY